MHENDGEQHRSDPALRQQMSEEGVRFLPPVARAFSTNPPLPTAYEILLPLFAYILASVRRSASHQ